MWPPADLPHAAHRPRAQTARPKARAAPAQRPGGGGAGVVDPEPLPPLALLGGAAIGNVLSSFTGLHDGVLDVSKSAVLESRHEPAWSAVSDVSHSLLKTLDGGGGGRRRRQVEAMQQQHWCAGSPVPLRRVVPRPHAVGCVVRLGPQHLQVRSVRARREHRVPRLLRGCGAGGGAGASGCC